MIVIETPRLILRRLTLDDAPFILELVNDPDWLRHIGDKNVRSLDDARAYLTNGPLTDAFRSRAAPPQRNDSPCPCRRCCA